MEDGGKGATANSSSNINGNISKKKALGGCLRNFRMDKEEANKGQGSYDFLVLGIVGW